jgi:unsaturated chondroitin disaccharide hydrolase
MLTQEEQEWVCDTLKKIERKMGEVSRRSVHKIPYTTVNGVHDDRSGDAAISWWTNGFWGGMMWQLYRLTGEQRYRDIAVENEEKLDRNLMNYDSMDHDNGFKWLPTAVANYRVTGNAASKNRGLLAAANFAGRYNPAGRFLRAWNDWGEDDHRGFAIIDCMMNLPLLYWAYEETADPRFLQVATAHADTTMRCFVRGDGSVNHIVEFNPETGEMVRSYGGQGYGEGSSWTRGQGWAIYGFVISYLHTKNPAYLETSKRIANYFIANIPENGLIPVDFRQPADCTWEDSIAAALAACGFIELAKLEKGRDQRVYLDQALRLLKTLADSRCSWDEASDELLEKCTAAYHDTVHEFSIIYGDYYFIEALMKLAETELFIW